MIRDIFEIYNRNWSQIFVWSLLIILPVTTISFLSMIYVFNNGESIAPHFFTGLSLLLNFIICIPPYMKMVLIDQQDDTFKPAEGILFFCKQFGILLIFTSLVYFIAYLGMFLLFIPTVLALIFLLVFPFFSEQRSVKEVMSQSVKAIARENVSLIGDLLVILSINLGIWAIITLFFEQYDNNLLAYLIIRIALNMLVFPFFYIYLTLRYRTTTKGQLADERW
ncbi:MAG TPA: hypothetical protein VNQ57_07355 [Ureibacillus sp.]|nr:hypothetical protein [Ureibacillus sp.]